MIFEMLTEHKMLYAILWVMFLSLCNSACVSHRVSLDPVTQSSINDGDATGIVEGCGNQPIVGFNYCRVSEGDASDQSITFIGPPAVCNQKDSCVFVKIWNNQGQLAAGVSIPKGSTRVQIPWKTLLAAPTFEVNSRGLWSWNTQVFYLGPDGKERSSTSQGDIVLRVYKKGYVDLHASETDPAYVWSWVMGEFQYKMTASLRAFIKKVQAPVK